jgi:hypothetical protein
MVRRRMACVMSADALIIINSSKLYDEGGLDCFPAGLARLLTCSALEHEELDLLVRGRHVDTRLDVGLV